MPRPAVLYLTLALCGTGCASAPRPRIAGAYRFECTPPDARIVVDEVDNGPCVLWSSRWLGVTAGPHRLQVLHPGYLPLESDLVPTGHRVSVQARLRPVPD